MSEKRILIIAGPNGAGKTTFARSFLPEEANCPHFINTDLIAAGLSPFAPQAAAVKAGRLMLADIDHCVAHGQSFAFETTLARVGYVRRIRAWRELGYHVSLFFLMGCSLGYLAPPPSGLEKSGEWFVARGRRGARRWSEKRDRGRKRFMSDDL